MMATHIIANSTSFKFQFQTIYIEVENLQKAVSCFKIFKQIMLSPCQWLSFQAD